MRKKKGDCLWTLMINDKAVWAANPNEAWEKLWAKFEKIAQETRLKTKYATKSTRLLLVSNPSNVDTTKFYKKHRARTLKKGKK